MDSNEYRKEPNSIVEAMYGCIATLLCYDGVLVLYGATMRSETIEQ